MNNFFTGLELEKQERKEISPSKTLTVRERMNVSDSLRASLPVVNSGAKVDDKGLLVESGDSFYIDLSGSTQTYSPKTIICQFSPQWDSSAKEARNYTVFGLTDSSNNGIFFKTNNSLDPFEWQVVDPSVTEKVASSQEYPHSAGAVLFAAITVAPNKDFIGYFASGNEDTYKKTILDDSPAGYWRLGEHSGTTAKDYSGNGNDGTYSDSALLGQPGALFSDSNFSVRFHKKGKVEIPAPLSSPSAWTYEAWFKPMGLGETDIIIGQNLLPILSWNTSGKVEASLGATGGSALSASSLQNNKWYHLVATFNDTTKEIRIYINGVIDVKVIYTGSATLPNDTHYINPTDFNSALNGFVDEVAVYSTELSGERIMAHYNAGVGVKFSNSNKSGGIGATNPTRLHLGSLGASEYLEGHIKEIRTYDRTLNAEEILEIMKWGIFEDSGVKYIPNVSSSFEIMTANINNVKILDDIVGTDTLTPTESTSTGTYKVGWEKVNA